ncbi:hypothetical protein EHS25_002786 [Saitozyma podzolica]|uniref:Cyclase n=1 Tax=Saitozyma podzolica TaxID=1890683 RepID=A0A427YDC1_9TREE|nr:hypothetical protein EHS25_002786 [Saitozyma podzolica]
MPDAITFEQLPVQKDGPPFNAWGLYGDKDELGRLNLITPEAIKRGRDEIRHGLVINLNLPLSIKSMHPERAELHHKINHRKHCNDDILTFNTQTSSQWDGFRHFPYQNFPGPGEYRFYNGLTMEEAKDPKVIRNGIQNFADKPITSRAHLLDIPRYLARHGLPPLAPRTKSTPITLDMLQKCASEAGIQFASGDILVLRTGWTEATIDLDDAAVQEQRKSRESCGVIQGEDVLKWHWENGIAAVVSDNPAYENFPHPNPSLHEVFLSGWGLPIGELFDLRLLAETCDRLKKWSFFFTSMPLYVEGGIASPPNAQAIL